MTSCPSERILLKSGTLFKVLFKNAVALKKRVNILSVSKNIFVQWWLKSDYAKMFVPPCKCTGLSAVELLT